VGVFLVEDSRQTLHPSPPFRIDNGYRRFGAVAGSVGGGSYSPPSGAETMDALGICSSPTAPVLPAETIESVVVVPSDCGPQNDVFLLKRSERVLAQADE
jgi:hypothetical protein